MGAGRVGLWGENPRPRGRGMACPYACELMGKAVVARKDAVVVAGACYKPIMAKGDEPREKHQRWSPGGTSTPAATTFAGNIMALIAMALLFDDDEEPADSTE